MERILAIPSKGRAGKLVSMKKIVPELAGRLPVYLVVEPQEEEAYRAAYPDMNLLVLPENDKGIGYSRGYMQKHWHGKIVAMIDDDINQFARREGLTKGGFPKLVHADPYEALSALFDAAEKHGYAGMSAQHSNFKMKSEGTTRIWNVAAFSPELLRKGVLYDPAAFLFEDFDLQAQALVAGFRTPTIVDYAFNTGEQIGAREGGCQSWDRVKLSETMSQYMLEKWGSDIVRLRANPRSGKTEPQFRWKKLCQIGAQAGEYSTS